MLLQSSNQVNLLVSGLQGLLSRGTLLDLTLAAGGKTIRAHRVVLASASKYFEELLSNHEEQLPVVFFRDVSFLEIESLVKYIYTGEVEVPGSALQSFLALAHSLGVTGFAEPLDKTPTKRKLEWGTETKENQAELPKKDKKPEPKIFSPLCTPSKSRSEPASLLETALQCSSTKKRKLQTQSLTDDLENIDPNLFNLSNMFFDKRRPSVGNNKRNNCDKENCFPNGGVLNPTSSPDPLNSTQSKSSHRVERSISYLTKLKASPFKDQTNHAPSSSLPAPQSPKTSNTSSQSGHSSNFSFDSHFLDPDELAAKGATLLHHLAVWMIQQRKDGNQHFYQGSGTYVGDDLPSPNLEDGTEKNEATPATRQQSVHTSSYSAVRKTGRKSLLSGSECDRPDSGFDSKDDQEEEHPLKRESSEGSPELGEMSRQAMARQPIKKKRVFHHNMI